MKLNVLGTEYELYNQSERDNPKLKAADGIAELYSKKLIFDFPAEDDEQTSEESHLYFESVVRHEIFHAFFYEAGLKQYTNDEVLVDFLANQFPKLQKLMEIETIEKIAKELRNASEKD